MVGPILGPCSPNNFVNGYKQARLNDYTIGFCGHLGIIVTASSNVHSDGIKEARLTDYVNSPCNIGIIASGSPDTYDNP